MSEHEDPGASGLPPSSASGGLAIDPSCASADGPGGPPSMGDGIPGTRHPLAGGDPGDIPSASVPVDAHGGPDGSTRSVPFPSVTALRWRHDELAKQLRSHGRSDQFWGT